jgi:hypothetical protein
MLHRSCPGVIAIQTEARVIAELFRRAERFTRVTLRAPDGQRRIPSGHTLSLRGMLLRVCSLLNILGARQTTALMASPRDLEPRSQRAAVVSMNYLCLEFAACRGAALLAGLRSHTATSQRSRARMRITVAISAVSSSSLIPRLTVSSWHHFRPTNNVTSSRPNNPTTACRVSTSTVVASDNRATLARYSWLCRRNKISSRESLA